MNTILTNIHEYFTSRNLIIINDGLQLHASNRSRMNCLPASCTHDHYDRITESHNEDPSSQGLVQTSAILAGISAWSPICRQQWLNKKSVTYSLASAYFHFMITVRPVLCDVIKYVV